MWFLLLPAGVVGYVRGVAHVPFDFASLKLRENLVRRKWRDEIEGCERYVYTRKFNETCMPMPKQKNELLPLLVTGSPGSGTRAAAHLLATMGLEVGHERYETGGTVSWTHAVNDYAFGTAYPFSSERTKWWHLRHLPNRFGIENTLTPRYQTVVHLVRCPLRSVASMLKPHAPIIRFVETATGISSPCGDSYDCETTLEERLGWATATYVAWNRHVESYADIRVRIENVFDPTHEKALVALCGGTKNAKRLCKFAATNETRAARREARAAKRAKPPPFAINAEHLRRAQYHPIGQIDADATVDAFIAMGTRYGYGRSCVRGDESDDAKRLWWSSKRDQVVAQPPVVEPAPEAYMSKTGIEQCLVTSDDDESSCSSVDSPCPTSAKASRDCLRAAVPFRTPYRRLKCCFRCCVDYWLNNATRLGQNVRYQASRIDEKPAQLGPLGRSNPDTGDFGLGDPVFNLLVHPHAFGAIADVRLHAMTGCFMRTPPVGKNATTIASLYHYTPDTSMFPERPTPLRHQRDFERDPDKFPCVEALRKSDRIVVDVFDPKKWVPGIHLKDKLALFMANNIDNDPDEMFAGKVRERVIGVRGVSVWQALLEHTDISRTFNQRTRLLLCCCMNIDEMHKGRMEHTKILAKHEEFDCPLKKKSRDKHIGRPLGDKGAHEIENEAFLMLNKRYENRQLMNGRFDAHMPVLMLESTFVYSPNGVGEQCYREYEALISGAIPVLDDSAYAFRKSLTFLQIHDRSIRARSQDTTFSDSFQRF